MVYTLFATFFAAALMGSVAIVLHELRGRIDQIEALSERYRAMKQAMAVDLDHSTSQRGHSPRATANTVMREPAYRPAIRKPVALRSAAKASLARPLDAVARRAAA